MPDDLEALSGANDALGRLAAKVRQLEQRNRELSDRAARWQRVFDAEPECVKIVDASGYLLEMNPAGLAMLEAESLEEARDRPLIEYILPEHRLAFALLHKEVMQGRTASLEFEIEGRRGQRRWLQTHATPLRDESGGIHALLGITRDITTNKRQERALRASDERFAKAFYSSPVPIVIGRLADIVITEANDAFFRTFETTPEAVLGRSPIDIGLIESSQALPIRDALVAEGALRDVEINLRSGTGRRMEVVFSAEVLDLEGGTHALFTVQDLTARHQAEGRLQTRARQQEAAASLASMALTLDLAALLDRAVVVVSDTLGAEMSKVLQLLPDGRALRLVAGVGWREGLVGHAVVPSGQHSQAGFTLRAAATVIVEDLRAETRFAGPNLLTEHDVVSGLSAVIRSAGDSWGVLGAHSRERRHFTADDVHFIETVADILAGALQRQAAEAAKRESAERLRLAVQAADVGLWDWDIRSNRLVYSREWKGQLGYDEHEISSAFSEWETRVHPEDLPGTLAQLQRYLAHPSGAHESEFRMRHKDGSWRWIYARGEVHTDGEGQAVRMLGCHVDITERKQAAIQIERLNRVHAVSTEVSQALVRALPPTELFDTVCRIAVETGNFRMACIALVTSEDAARVDPVAFAGASTDTAVIVRRLMLDDDPEGGCHFPRQAAERGEPAVCNDIQHDDRARTWRAAAIERGYLSMASFPLTLDGRVTGTFNLYAAEPNFFDTAEMRLLRELSASISFGLEVHRREEQRRQTEASLRRSEERFREIAETIQEVFWVIDLAKDHIIYVSPAYDTIWGRPRESLYASPRSWTDAIHAEDRARVAKDARSRQVEGTYDEEYRIVRPDGDIRWIRDRAFPVRGVSGRVERLVGVARDVTDRKAAEEQLRQAQKMESVGRLAAGIAHDFNNVLTVIGGIAGLHLADLPANSPLRPDLATIAEATARAAQLTHQLLAFSRKQVLRPVTLDLNGLVVETKKLLLRVIGEDVTIVVRLAPNLPRVAVDPGQMHQVILNLAVNSRDAMPHGGTLKIETQVMNVAATSNRHGRDLKPGRYVALSIADTGTGIPPSALSRIFEPFFTTKDSSKGTGLGLATVHGIVKQSGGDVRVESEVGRGTTFTILLPPAAHDVVPARAESASTVDGVERLLVVDDDAGVRNLTKRMLERAGYTVAVAANGAEALEMLDDSPDRIDLVIADVVMPGMSGREMVEQIVDRRPGVRVLFTSGYTDDAILRYGVLDDGIDLLSKPFGAKELITRVRLALDGPRRAPSRAKTRRNAR